jgi:hypothetical protein
LTAAELALMIVCLDIGRTWDLLLLPFSGSWDRVARRWDNGDLGSGRRKACNTAGGEGIREIILNVAIVQLSSSQQYGCSLASSV